MAAFLWKKSYYRWLLLNPGKTFRNIMHIKSTGANHTRQIGGEFSGRLKSGDIVCCIGNLGSGKTTFIQGLCAGLQVRETVNSPTFTLINEYHGILPVFHFDFYRVNDPEELLELGLEEYFEKDGICLIEWPDIISDLLPNEYYRVTLEHDFEHLIPDIRNISIERITD